MSIVSKPALAPAVATTAVPATPPLQTGAVPQQGVTVPASQAMPDARQILGQADAAPAPPMKSAVQAAAAGQRGLAPLMADLAQAQRMPDLPASVQTALLQVLALRRPVDAAPTGQDIKTALMASGLFSDKKPAAGLRPANGAASAAPAGADIKTALTVLKQVLKTWLAATPAAPDGTAPAKQGAPAPARSPATLPPAAAHPPASAHSAPAPATPAAAPSAATPGAATKSDTAAPSPAAATPAAAAQPRLAVAGVPAPAPSPAALPSSLSQPAPSPVATAAAPPAALEPAAKPQTGSAHPAPPAAASAGATPALQPKAGTPAQPQSVFQQPNASASPPAQHAGAAQPPAAGPRSGPALAGAQPQPALALLPLQQGAKPAPSPGAAPAFIRTTPQDPGADAARTAANPPPPYRGGPTSAQPPLPPTFAPDADPRNVARALLTHTEGALSHVKLLQIASLPDAPQASARAETQGPRWMFEIPFATPQGTAIAQFEINRDPEGDAEYAAPVWRARFSIDVEPMGPVHAQAVLLGEHVWVTVWAEREASIQTLRDKEALLRDALAKSDFVPELAFCAGAPRAPAAAAGRFLDSAS